MTKNFFHAGKKGDLIYSLPTIRALAGEAIIYLPERTHECSDLYSSMKSLLEYQPYIKEVREAPDITAYHQCPVKVDYDLDRARLQPGLGRVHIIKRYMNAFRVKVPDNWNEPWLWVERRDWHGLKVFNVTSRFRSKETDWSQYMNNLISGNFFIGTDDEYRGFKENVKGKITRIKTRDVHEAAQLIAGASALYCNQSLCLTLAQGLGIPYYLERYKDKTNTHLHTKNEHLI